ncbi:LytR/AlgR family response regulator transcription factor [Chryseobacterium sp. SL1]|uniref:LytR/AlgR family response regulator transcription factor n=1 Tax=Chryseobacterium sp. SL1 TaxID=2995159 RepID=UPI002275A39A|nr:LytTR family DNA-binding domain-containing protein [Chryseobacterium sp. SL1]MCY1662557.1 LytTR family DNA-binding domain-containing protein [Chryseobacterium sp. SL1]
MRAVIVDDERANIENLHILLNKYCPKIKIIATATQIEEAVGILGLHHPDLLFLDIQLGKRTGFDLLKQVTEKTFEVIFVTAFDQYGIQAVKFAALDYLLKPVNPDELIGAVAKASQRIQNKMQNEQLNFLIQQVQKPEKISQKIALQQHHEIRYVDVDEILRCEADNTYTFFFLTNGDKILISKPLKEYSDLLKPNGFLRTHQSHLVNPLFVKSWLKEDGGILLLKNGDRIPVSKSNRESVKAYLSS